MKKALFLGFAVSMIARGAFAADAQTPARGAIGLGLDNAGATLGEHVSAELNIADGIALGLDLANREYKAASADLATIAGKEELAYVRLSHAVTQNVSVFQRLGAGQAQMPEDATVKAFNVVDAQTGVRLDTGRIYTQMGFGLRANLIDEPVRVGAHAIAAKYQVYPTVAIGTTF